MSTLHTQAGIAHLAVALSLAIVAAIGGGGYYVYRRNQVAADHPAAPAGTTQSSPEREVKASGGTRLAIAPFGFSIDTGSETGLSVREVYRDPINQEVRTVGIYAQALDARLAAIDPHCADSGARPALVVQRYTADQRTAAIASDDPTFHLEALRQFDFDQDNWYAVATGGYQAAPACLEPPVSDATLAAAQQISADSDVLATRLQVRFATARVER